MLQTWRPHALIALLVALSFLGVLAEFSIVIFARAGKFAEIVSLFSQIAALALAFLSAFNAQTRLAAEQAAVARAAVLPPIPSTPLTRDENNDIVVLNKMTQAEKNVPVIALGVVIFWLVAKLLIAFHVLG